VANLIATSPLGFVKPISFAATTLAQCDWVQITSIAPYLGRVGDVSAALAPLGLGFPAPSTLQTAGDARIIWAGRDQAFLMGAPCPDMGGAAAVTDQSDAWARFSLVGPAAVDTLARYIPIDLRPSALPVGAAIRSQLYHMPLCLMRLGNDAFDLLVFRSMARTGWHELEVALRTLAARAQ
jgi:heterotetrameric sarcosine oxidase gamma subunit